jgi:hypothetical protein
VNALLLFSENLRYHQVAVKAAILFFALFVPALADLAARRRALREW